MRSIQKTHIIAKTARVNGIAANAAGKLVDPLDLISERDFQANVRKLAKLLGWHEVGCTWNSRHSVSGEPDLRLCRERVIWLELKRERGRCSDTQTETIAALRAAGAEVHVFRPSDWYQIETILDWPKR